MMKMEGWEETGVVIADVRGGVQPNKLLFRLGAYQNKIVILLKRHGEENSYMISVYELLEPFVQDKKALLKVTTLCDEVCHYDEMKAKTK